MAKKRKKKNKYQPIIYGCVVVILALILFFIYDQGLFPSLPDSSLSSSSSYSSSSTSTSYSDAKEIDIDVIKGNDISFHFMELGNKYTGDSTLVKANDVEVLIDAGSKKSSIDTIYNYVSQYIEGSIEYIIVTHAHEDHYAGFSTSKYEDSLFYKLNVNENTTIIDFSMITTGKEDQSMYKAYKANVNKAIENGAKHYTCKELIEENKALIKLTSSVTMKILDSKYYYEKSSSENDHSVCSLFTCGSLNYLLTGDLEEKGEKALLERNDLPKVELYKAGHHGSNTSSCPELLEVIQPKIVTVCCCAGSSEYTENVENQFPTVEFLNNIAPYTDRVYVTTECIDYSQGKYQSLNGNIVITNKKEDQYATVYCSNSNKVLKDSDWYKNNRS